LKYLFEVASDTNFNTILFSKADVAPGDANRTSVRLPEAIASSRTYLLASAGRVTARTLGPYSGFAGIFNIYTPIVHRQADSRNCLSTGTTLAGIGPEFRHRERATIRDPVGANHLHDRSRRQATRSVTSTGVWSVAEQPGQTRLDAPRASSPGQAVTTGV
jgi:hypothetical protein